MGPFQRCPLYGPSFLQMLTPRRQLMQCNYTIGPRTHEDPYHGFFAGVPLSKRLAKHYLEIHEEVILAFDNLFQMQNHGGCDNLPFLFHFMFNVQQNRSR